MEIGFIGLGAMGLPMARNLIKAGHDLTVWNRTAEVSQQLRPEGARIAAAPAEACRGEFLITMVSDDRALEELFFGEPQLMARLHAGSIHVSMSTISPAQSSKLSQSHAKAGSLYVSAPVFGRPDAAAGAKLMVVAAGPAEAVSRCQSIFSAVGSKTLTLGENPSAANVFKISGNFLIASVIESLGEAFALLRKSGVDPRLFLDTMTGGLFSCPIYKNYGTLILEEKSQDVGFSVRLGLKDVKLVLSAGESATVPMPVANVIRDHLLAAMARGWQERDWSSLARVAAADARL